MSRTPRDSFKDAIDGLTQARDEARLGLHLLTLEGKQKWDELEGKATELEMKLGEGAERAAEMHAQRAEELTRVVHAFVDAHIRRKTH